MKKLSLNLGILISSLSIFLIVYLPVYRNIFLSYDDYLWIWTTLPAPELFSSILTKAISEGRILMGLVQYLFFDYIDLHKSIEATIEIRFIGIIGMVLLSYIIFKTLQIFNINRIHAYLLSIMLSTLPPYSFYLSNIVSLPFIYSAVLSSFSAFIVNTIVFTENVQKRTLNLSKFAIAITCFVLAIAIFQPTAMMYFGISIIPVALLEGDKFRIKYLKFIGIHTVITLTSFATYFVVNKIFLHIAKLDAISRFTLTNANAIPYKIAWFLGGPLKISLNLWYIPSSYTIAIFMLIVILGIFYNPKQTIRGSPFIIYKHIIGKFILILCILILTYLPCLIVLKSPSSYRTLIALSSAICILLYSQIIRIADLLRFTEFSENTKSNIVTIFIIIVTVFACYSAYRNTDRIVTMHTSEFKYVKDSISKQGDINILKIYIITETLKDTRDEISSIKNIIREYGIFNLSKIIDIYMKVSNSKLLDRRILYEFGYPSSIDAFLAIPMVKLALYDFGITNDMPIECVTADRSLMNDKNILIIDLTKLDFNKH